MAIHIVAVAAPLGQMPPPPPMFFFSFVIFFLLFFPLRFFFFCLSAQRSVMVMIIPLPHYDFFFFKSGGGGGKCVGVPIAMEGGGKFFLQRRSGKFLMTFLVNVGPNLASNIQEATTGSSFRDYLCDQAKGTLTIKPITEYEVQCQLLSLKVNKACGHDTIPARLIRDAADFIARPLSHIFNLTSYRKSSKFVESGQSNTYMYL